MLLVFAYVASEVVFGSVFCVDRLVAEPVRGIADCFRLMRGALHQWQVADRATTKWKFFLHRRSG